jgi:hypothetical protein
MRKSTALTFMLFFALLLSLSNPAANAQNGPVQCTASGSYWLPVALGGQGFMERPQSTPEDIQAGLNDDDPQSNGYSPYFTMMLDNGELNVLGHGLFPSSSTPANSLNYRVLQRDDTIVVNEIPGPHSDPYNPLFNGLLTKVKGAPGFNHLAVSMTGQASVAELVDNNEDGFFDTLEGSVETDGVTLLFDTPLQGYSAPSGRKYVLIPQSIDIGAGNIIPGPMLRLSTPQAPFGEMVSGNGVYIPAASDYRLYMQCGDVIFGPILRAATPGALVPALSGSGLLIFSVVIFGLGIWAMRRGRFGSTLANS